MKINDSDHSGKSERRRATGETPPRINDRGEWSPDASYKQNDGVKRHGTYYVLRAIGSLNEDPATTGRAWQAVPQGPGQNQGQATPKGE